MTDRTHIKPNRPEIPIQKYALFADESGISDSRFSLVGGTVVRSDRLEVAYSMIAELRLRHGMSAEFKWSKVSNQKLDAYTELVDLYFQLVKMGYFHFLATSFDNHKWKHQIYNDGDSDIGLSKNYYQMILHQFVGNFGDLASLFVCLDRRLSSTPLEDLHRMINRGATREYGLSFGPVRVLISRDSKTDDILQINDVILGAVAAYKNQRHLDPKTRVAKAELAKRVLEKSKLASYDIDSPKSRNDFRIWNRQPR